MVDRLAVTLDVGPYLAELEAALSGEYAFLVDDLGFERVGEPEVEDNRPAPDVCQELRRGDLRLRLSTGGDVVSASRRPLLEVLTSTRPVGVPAAAEAVGEDPARVEDDPAGLARDSLTRLVESPTADVDRQLVDAQDRLVARCHEQRELAEQVREWWRAHWADLGVVSGVTTDGARSSTRGVSTASGVTVLVVLDWASGVTRGEWVAEGTVTDVGERLRAVGADGAAGRVERAAGGKDAMRATARAMVTAVVAEWSGLAASI